VLPWFALGEPLAGCFGGGDAVYQVDQTVVVDAGMLAQADLAGAAGGNAFSTGLYRVFQAAQGVAIQLWSGEAFVAGKAAAVDAFGDDDVLAAAAHEVDQVLRFAQVLGAAGDVYGDWLLLWAECQSIQQLLADKFHRIKQV